MEKRLDLDDVQRLELSLIRLNQFVRQHQFQIKGRYKISALEMEILQFVIQQGPQKMKSIAEHFHIKLSTLTSIIDKSEQSKILKRVNSKEDRRVVYLDASKKGRAIFDNYRTFIKELVLKMQESLHPQKFELFVESIETFTDVSLN